MIMRGRRPAGPNYVDRLPGSPQARERLRVVLETIAGQRSVIEACALLGVCPQRFHQLRESSMLAAMADLEPGTPGRPAQTSTAVQEQIDALQEQLADKDVELRAAQARAEIAVAMPRVVHQPTAEKKTAERRGNSLGPGLGRATTREPPA
jgi:hypothetical protein